MRNERRFLTSVCNCLVGRSRYRGETPTVLRRVPIVGPQAQSDDRSGKFVGPGHMDLGRRSRHMNSVLVPYANLIFHIHVVASCRNYHFELHSFTWKTRKFTISVSHRFSSSPTSKKIFSYYLSLNRLSSDYLSRFQIHC